MAALRAVTVAILAGGAGARFGGRDKGLIEVGGRPLVAWALGAIPPSCDRLIVANRHREDYTRFAPVASIARSPLPLPRLNAPIPRRWRLPTSPRSMRAWPVDSLEASSPTSSDRARRVGRCCCCG